MNRGKLKSEPLFKIMATYRDRTSMCSFIVCPRRINYECDKHVVQVKRVCVIQLVRTKGKRIEIVISLNSNSFDHQYVVREMG